VKTRVGLGENSENEERKDTPRSETKKRN